MKFRADPSVVPLAEGERGAGDRRGEPGLGDFRAGTYPACSLHGAMNRVGRDRNIWRCLVEGCNAGAEWDPPTVSDEEWRDDEEAQALIDAVNEAA